MLTMHSTIDTALVVVNVPAPDQSIIWLDLIAPTHQEVKLVEERLSISMPTLAEMEEIEPSARLYREDGAVFLTVTAVSQQDSEDPVRAPISFVLKNESLVTIRYADLKPFDTFIARAQRPGGARYATGLQVMLGLIEALTDRLADTLERVGAETDVISRGVFLRERMKVNKKTRDLEALISQIGQKVELVTMLQESLVNISRLVAYFSATEKPRGVDREQRDVLRLIQRDATSLGEHARALSTRLNFLLDATLGLINLEQNQIIKIFSVAAVVFLPPTVVASVYGMNFTHMPELDWPLGYPYAILVMILSSLLPYLFFRRKGWL